MAARLVFHLGDCKTGTTALQAALADGRVRVDGQAPCYPALLNHNGLAQALIHPDRWDEGLARLATLGERLAASDAALGVVSAEHFEFLDPARLQQALRTAWPDRAEEIGFLAYVRPHGARALSSFAEMVKLGEWRGDLAGFLDRAVRRDSYHYAPRFARWRAVFGDRFTLRLYQRDALAGGDLVTDAMAAMMPGAQIAVTPGPAENESLSLPALATLQGLHARLPAALHQGRAWRKPVAALGRGMAAVLAADLPGPRLGLPGDLAARLVATYRADAQALDAAFFAGPDGPNGPDGPMTRALLALPGLAPGSPQTLDPAAHLPPDGLRQLDLWADVFGRLILADPGHFAWAARDPAWRSGTAPGGGQAPDSSAQDDDVLA